MRHTFRIASSVLTLSAALFACSSAPTDDAESSSSAVVARPDLHEFGATRANKRICPPAGPGEAQCHAHVLTDETGSLSGFTNSAGVGGIGADAIAAAYNIPTSLASTATIAVVDAYDYPTAGSDLYVYRNNFGLPELCDGCFQRVNQSGVASSYPAAASANGNWQIEEGLDLQMASAACPSCKLLLVEANSTSNDDLYSAVDTAVRLGASVVSLSWGSSSSTDLSHLNHPGVAIFASSGDSGYGIAYPAASPLVTAVGGTALTAVTPTAANPRGWTEVAWAGAGSGCSTQGKPSWQKDTQCSSRTIADVSAVASGSTPVAIYVAGSWFGASGTSVASPLVAGIYANTGHANATGQYSYANLTNFYDVIGGSTGSCGGSYLCTSVAGYDGPTGNGSPNAAAMAGYPSIVSLSPTSGTNAGGTDVVITGTNFSTAPGGTQVTFGGKAAAAVNCPSTTLCHATSPLYSEQNTAQTLDVQVTVAGKTDQPGPQDRFTYTAGPTCTAAFNCTGIAFGEPELVITCPSTVSFYTFAGTSNQTLAATGTTFTISGGNPGMDIAACVAGGSCTAYSNAASTTYCGSVPKPPPPPSTCDGLRAPGSKCSAGWHCCGSDGWSCGVCQ